MPLGTERVSSLLFRMRGRLCALPLSFVVETTRPRSLIPLSGVKAGVFGARIPGRVIPVVEPGAPFGPSPRFPDVMVQSSQRRYARLAAEEVLGVATLDVAASSNGAAQIWADGQMGGAFYFTSPEK